VEQVGRTVVSRGSPAIRACRRARAANYGAWFGGFADRRRPPGAYGSSMSTGDAAPRRTRLELAQRVALVRIGFGLIWLVDAALKLNSSFIHGFQSQIVAAADGQPAWLRPWFDFWADVTGSSPHAFAYLTVVLEAVIALGLLLGLGRRIGYLVAFVYSLALWAIPEGFGGPYGHGSTDLNAGLIYAVVFAALYGLETMAGGAWAIDRRLERRFPVLRFRTLT
jgi:thiosulfate dehydrogenase [quinone] large subunit